MAQCAPIYAGWAGPLLLRIVPAVWRTGNRPLTGGSDPRHPGKPAPSIAVVHSHGQSGRLDDEEGQMAPRIVVGVFQSEGIAEDARNRLKTEGVSAGDVVLKVLKEIGPIPSTMEPELRASFLGPVFLGNFRGSFAHYIRNGEMLVCVQALTDEQVELAVGTLKQYAPIEVRVVSSAEEPDR